MNFFIILASVFLLASCGGSYEPVCSIEINGDSVLAESKEHKSGSYLLKEFNPGWKIDDRSVIGLSLDSLMKGYKVPYPGAPIPQRGAQPSFQKTDHWSEYVVIELGGNDAYDGYTPDQFETQLIEAVTYLKSIGKIPVLTGIVQVESWGVFDAKAISLSKEMDAMSRKIATQFSIPHAGWGDFSPRTTDGIHPDEFQLKVLLKALSDAIKDNGKGVCSD